MKCIAGRRGFTLIEVLVVIGIIGVLAAVVLVAINPSRQFRQANNAQRQSNVSAIINAIGQYAVDHKGALPAEIQSDDDEINGSGGDDFADLCDDLVPTYLPALPVDPSIDTDESITENECDESYTTGYVVEEANGRITVSAPHTEDVDEGGTVPADDRISVTR